MNKPILYDYFFKKADVLLSKYKLSSEQKASRNVGDNRENFINMFLREALPKNLEVKCGEVIDNTGLKTGQLDTIIVRSDSPRLDFEGNNSYLAEGVFAVIETKSNLTTTKLAEAANTLDKVRQLAVSSSSIASGNNLNRPIRIVFAYEGVSWDTITNTLDKNRWQDLFDLICVLSNCIYITKSELIYLYDKLTNQKLDEDLVIMTKASSLGFLNYYLWQYGTAFSVVDFNLQKYFLPLEEWTNGTMGRRKRYKTNGIIEN